MPATRATPRVAGWAVALATFALLALTEPRLAIVWDEGYTLGRVARLRLWVRALADPPAFAAHWSPPVEEMVQQVGARPPLRDQVDSRSKLLFDPRVLAWFWPFAREEPHGHPPFYALVALAGDVLTPWRPALARARLGPMIAFSLAAGVLFAFAARRYGRPAGWLAAGAWVFQPNLFAHAHYATYDALLSILWLGTLLAFAKAVEDGPGASPRSPRWGWAVAFGLLLGCAADTKLTGWFLPLPVLAWVAVYRSRRGGLTLLVGGLVAIGLVYALTPPWWVEPVAGPVRFFSSNFRRDETIRIKTLFLGQVVSTPDGSLPWYNTLVWTALVTPVGFLALAVVGAGRAVARWKAEPLGLLVVGNWAFFLLLRAMPHTPGHDGVRQFLPAFALLAWAAALGAASVAGRFGRLGRGLVAASMVEGLVSVIAFMPVPLSYYSPAVGGLPGATALGMEPTFYWDALTDDALDWIKANTPAGKKVRFASYPTTWLYLRAEGRLPLGVLPSDPGEWAWYVVQNRPGAFSPIDRALARRGRPAYVVSKFGVPLLWVFPFDQVEALLRPGSEGRGPSKTGTAPHAGGVGAVPSDRTAVNDDRLGSLARGVGLRAAVRLRGGVGDRSPLIIDRRGARGRGLVAEAAELELLVPAEQAALLGRRGARRRGRRARLDDHARGRLRARDGALLLLVTSLGVGRRQSTEQADEGQGQKIASHGGLLSDSHEGR